MGKGVVIDECLASGVDWSIEEGCVCSVAQSCLTLCDPTDCSPPGSSVHGIFQARILERVAISFSRGSSQHRDQTHVPCISCIGGFLTTELPGEAGSACIHSSEGCVQHLPAMCR